jgi:hypothetical protein
MSPMNPRLMRPLAAGNRLSVFATAGYTRLWAVTTQSGGDITGSAETDTGYYAVKWWDNTVDIYDSGDPFSKAALGNQRAFEVYPCDIAGVPGGQFDGFDLSDNSLTQVRSEGVTLASSGGALTGGYAPYGYWWWGPFFSPIDAENGIISDNLLSAEALDQFYTDLDAGTGSLFVAGNPGIDADDPTIATAKGYAVFGSVPPETSLLLNFNGTNGSTTFTDSSPNGLTVTANGDAQISTAQSKFGGASGYFDGNGDYLSLSLEPLYSDDFTIEFWFYRVAAGSGQVNTLFAAGNIQSGVGGFHIYAEPNGTLVWNDGTTAAISGGSAPVGEWVHVAAVRMGSTNTLYVNGTSVGTSTQTFPVGNAVVEIGGTPRYGFYINCYIDDLRILKGIALYTANFTPPASELEVYP